MILIVVEHANGRLRKSTYEMTKAARDLGCEGQITLLVLGSNVAGAASEAALLADQVLVADHPKLAAYDAELWASAVAQIAKEGEAHRVLIAGSRSGREYSPRVAVRLDVPLIEDAVSLRDVDGATVAERYTYLARVTEQVRTFGTVVITAKPGAFPMAATKAERAEEFDVELDLPERRLLVTGCIAEKSERISLGDAEIVVSGGRGLGSPESFVELVEGLANELGAAVGATRAVVDAGWRPYSEQVGQTGKTVQPRAYFALGISGAVQHLSGMGKSKLIVAVNKDPEAPIFKACDYGIVGDVREIVPALIRELKETH